MVICIVQYNVLDFEGKWLYLLYCLILSLVLWTIGQGKMVICIVLYNVIEFDGMENGNTDCTV